jgi:hypothetical protein
MAWFDYDEIEEVLDLVVPDVFRLFMDTAEAHSLPIAEFEFYDNTQSLIDGNWQVRLNWGGWKDNYLALGTGDGSGNLDFILARSEDDDEICRCRTTLQGLSAAVLPQSSSAKFGICSRHGQRPASARDTSGCDNPGLSDPANCSAAERISADR